MTTHVRGSERPTEPSAVADAPVGTGSGSSRVLGTIALAGVALVAFLGLVASPPDTEMYENVRLMYVHVPSAVAAYAGILVTTIGSVMFLWKRSQWWDLVAASTAEVATVFTALTLVTGSIWGRPTWGVYWVWDARLTSTAMLFLLLLGYLAVRRTSFDPDVRGRRAAIVGLLLLPNVVIVNRSVEWWRSLHQEPTLLRLNPTIGGLQLFTLMTGIVVALIVMLWFVVHRFRLNWLQEQLAAQDVEAAIAVRRAGEP